MLEKWDEEWYVELADVDKEAGAHFVNATPEAGE